MNYMENIQLNKIHAKQQDRIEHCLNSKKGGEDEKKFSLLNHIP